MIIGMVLVGAGMGAVLALVALALGQSLWMALLIYSATGVLSVLAVAVAVAMRPGAKARMERSKPYALADPQRS